MSTSCFGALPDRRRPVILLQKGSLFCSSRRAVWWSLGVSLSRDGAGCAGFCVALSFCGVSGGSSWADS